MLISFLFFVPNNIDVALCVSLVSVFHFCFSRLMVLLFLLIFCNYLWNQDKQLAAWGPRRCWWQHQIKYCPFCPLVKLKKHLGQQTFIL